MHRLFAGPVVLPCVALAAACARPASLPSFSHYSPAPADRSSPPTPADGKVTLREILDYADRNAPAIAAARTGAARADAERIAASPLVPSEPQLTVAAGARRAAGDSTVEAEVGIAQEVEIAGQRGLRFEVADAADALERRRLEQVRWQVHLEVHTAFHEALVARERFAAAEQLVAFGERLLEVAGKRRDAGDISPLQVEVAEGELALASQELVDARSRYRDARLALAEHSGWNAEQPPEPVGDLDRPRRVTDPDPLVRYALTHHPDLQLRAAEVSRARAKVRLTDREAWPNPVVGLSLAREREPGGAAEAQQIGVVSVTVPLPLFRGNRPARARARASWIGARAAEDAVRRVVRVRVVRAVAAVNAAAERVEAYGSEILPAFSSNMTKLVRAFELGEVDVLEVMVARGRFLELQRQALTAYADYFRAIAALEGETGGDVWPDEHREDDHDGGDR
jgi:cobalt-zinc-cadmium efflux system outer membrane protein